MNWLNIPNATRNLSDEQFAELLPQFAKELAAIDYHYNYSEEELRQDWDEQDMKNIARAVPSKVYKDCQKEEPETVSQIENFGKMCSSVAMKYCREILNNR